MLRNKWHFVLILGLVLMMAILSVGCTDTKSVDETEFYLKRALDEIGDLRRSMWYVDYVNVDDVDPKLDYIERDLESALDEIYNIKHSSQNFAQ